MRTEPLLVVDDVVVQFCVVTAVDHASFVAESGRITGLIGPNGAGKTTCFNVITGLQKPTRGKVRFRGRNVSHTPVHRRARRGMGRTFQRLEAFGRLLRELAAEGRGIVMVEHDMDLVMSVCDEIHVLDFGRVIASGAPAEVRADPAVQQAYLGYSDTAEEADGEHLALDETRTDLQPVELTRTVPAVPR